MDLDRPGRRRNRFVSALFFRRAKERDMDDEIRFHLDRLVEQHRARGLSPQEALRRARAEFGGVEAVKEEVRDAWSLSQLTELGRDTRLALRGFRKRPAYAATVVVTLALALGAVGSVWTSLWSVLYRPLPIGDDSRLFVISQTQRETPELLGLSPLELADYRESATTIDGLVEYHTMNFTLLGHGEARRVRVGVVSPEYFATLSVAPQVGRGFVAADDAHGATPVLLLSDAFWRREFGGDPAIVGASFTMNDRGHTVVGVLPRLPPMPDELDVYMPVTACPFRAGPHWSNNRSARGLVVMGRLVAGATPEMAASEIGAIGERLAAASPADYPAAQGLQPIVRPVREALTRDARPTLWVLAGAAIAVLLLVCANLVNLTVAQLQRREAEFAMRTALGGTRARLTRQLVVEGTVLSLLGGVVGLGLAFATQGLLGSVLGRLTPRAAEISFGATTAAAVFGLSLVIGVLLGLVPSLLEARRDRGARNLAAALRCDGSTVTVAAGKIRLRDSLVVVQVAASFVLLISAGLLIGSFRNLQRLAPGFAHPQVLTLHLAHNWTKYGDDASQIRYGDRLMARLREVPGVDNVALADSYPLNRQQPWNRRVAIGRAAPQPAEPGPAADFRVVTPTYFSTVGVTLLDGRVFTDDDRDGEHAVAVVNASFARILFPDRDPLGQEVIFGGSNVVWRIVGVVADVRQRTLQQEPRPELFAPAAIAGLGDMRVLVRGRQITALEPSLRAAIRDVDPEQPVHDVRTLEEARTDALAGPRATALLLALAAGVALAIAASGLAGLLAYSLGQRHREFAIRLALGATRGDIARLALGRTGALVTLGTLVGLAGSLLATRGLDSLLFGMASTDPATYVTVALVLFVAAFAAALPTLRRAILTAPSLALRAL